MGMSRRPDWLVAVGALVLSVGVGLMYIPAGIICAGVAMIGFGIVWAVAERNESAG